MAGSIGDGLRNVLSGAVVRLRALSDATLVRIAALGDGKALAASNQWDDEESGKFESWNLVTGPDRGVGDPDCLFSLMLWHEEEYRNARRFALNVRPLNKAAGPLGFIHGFRPSGELSSDFIEGGWRIAAINGRPATAEDVEAILAFGAHQDGRATNLHKDIDDDVSEDGVSPGPSMVEPAESLRSRTQKFMPVGALRAVDAKGAGISSLLYGYIVVQQPLLIILCCKPSCFAHRVSAMEAAPLAMKKNRRAKKASTQSQRDRQESLRKGLQAPRTDQKAEKEVSHEAWKKAASPAEESSQGEEEGRQEGRGTCSCQGAQ
eukprot:s180_g47.t1